MRISELSLSNFCGFSNFRLPLSEFNVLVGRNNGGKTTILRAIRMVFDAVEVTVEEYAAKVRKWKQGEADLRRSQEEQRRNIHQMLSSQSQVPEQVRKRELEQSESQFRSQLDNHKEQFPKWHCDVTKLVQRYALNSSQWLHFRHLEDQPASLELRVKTVLGDLQLCLEILESTQASMTCRLQEHDLLTLPLSECERLFADLGKERCFLFVPVKHLSAYEKSIIWPQVQDAIAKGQDDGVWRNSLHWLCDGKPPETFQRIIGRVQEAMPAIAVRPPSRTRDKEARVVVTYGENGGEFDISEAGAGLKTYLSLVASVELSESPILLFDEPDSHLHSSVQRQLADFLESQASGSRQIIVATHAPDLIDESPLESILWIDRSATEARKCDDLAKTMVELGALSHVQAIEFIRADNLIFFEAKPDRKLFESLLSKCGFGDMLKNAQVAPLKGCGDIQHLPGFTRIASKLLGGRRVAVAAIRDSDYETPRGEEDPNSGVLVVALPCKEIENLLLLAPDALVKAAARAAENRQEFTNQECRGPTLEEIEKLIDEVSATDVIREMVEYNWVANRLRPKTDGGDLAQRQKEFRTSWSDPAFRRRCGPGKAIMARLKKRLQEEYAISLSSPFDFYEPTDEVKAIFKRIQDHFQLGQSGRPA